ncbi:MAG: CTP-dependent riboflavin kinase [Desulfurococcales archaeon]|nr:CTP-dependent riboflavin kinase [Desulfurococcales archaeon]
MQLPASTGCRREFKATVFTGLGEGAFYVSIYGKGFRHKLGITPYPGTLNARLADDDVEDFNKCLKSLEGTVIEPPEIPGVKLAPVMVYPAYINGIPVWIVRPQITVYKENVVEFVAEENLRELLNLQDGDLLRIILGDP